MKKVFLLLLIVLVGCSPRNPKRFKGCVVVNKDDVWLQLKLNDSLAEKEKADYIWIYTVKQDSYGYKIGDTIR